MTMQRWDPFGDFGGTMDRFFEEGLARPWRFLRGVEDTLSFPVDVCETENEIEVRALLPGAKPDDIDVSVHDDMLVIKAETRQESEAKEKSFYRQEVRYGRMQRFITLPSRVDAERADARFENGALVLKLPKSEHERAKQIKVAGGGERPIGPGAMSGSGQGQTSQHGQGQSSGYSGGQGYGQPRESQGGGEPNPSAAPGEAESRPEESRSSFEQARTQAESASPAEDQPRSFGETRQEGQGQTYRE